MSRLHDLSVLAQHYTGLFGPRGLLLLADRALRRALPARAYRPIQRRLWLTSDARPRTKDERSQSEIRNPKSEIRNWFLSRFPGAVEHKIAAADHICNHIFDFLGTGLAHWGDPIDWHLDVKSGHRWPVKFYTEYRDDELMPGNGVDIKIPWELSRLHHFVTLAQAYWLTGDQRYADEIFSQWETWHTANPWPYGIHWTSAMEAAIRAVNLLWARALLETLERCNADMFERSNVQTFKRSTDQSLRQHGLFIEHNLEVSARNGHIVAANHYLANVCGLACLGLCCPELPEADRWRQVGLKALEQEIQRQVLPDGFFFESSTSYHRLAVELFLIPALLARQAGYEMSGTYWQRLEQMLEVILHITRSDGCVPQIGDNDDGRLLVLSGYPDWPRHDHRYLLALGAVLFERGDFKAAALGGNRIRNPKSAIRISTEEVFWLLGREGVEQFDALEPDPTPLGSRAFPHAGLYVIRSHDNRDYALVRTSTKIEGGKWRGEEGRWSGEDGKRKTGFHLPFSIFHSPSSILHLPSAHAHNDTLSLELWVDGQPVFLDPGTYCYTSDLEQRNGFRSTSAHNTVMIDGQEISRIPLGEPFRLERDAQAQVPEWQVGPEGVRLVVEHNGYRRLASPMRHRRCVHYDAAHRAWSVTDELVGTGTHTVVWHWHGDADTAMRVECVDEGVRHIQVTTAAAQILVAINSPILDWSHGLDRSSYALRYGVCKPASCLWVAVRFEEYCSLSWRVRSQRPSSDIAPDPVCQGLNVAALDVV